MKKKSQKIILALLVGMFFCSVCLSGCGEKSAESSVKKTAEVKIGSHVWIVELAMTRETRYMGLSGVRELPDNRGMLFIYPRAIPLKFCMRGCLIPIDIVFISSDLRVVNTYAMQVEANRRGIATASYSSGIPAQYALELPGGSVKKSGIRNGDLVELLGVPSGDQAEPAE